MKTKIIKIKNSKAIKVCESDESIGFIHIQDTTSKIDKLQNILKLKPKAQGKKESIMDLQGIWKNRTLSFYKLREKAWPARN